MNSFMEMQKWLTTVSVLLAAVLSCGLVTSVQAESTVRKTKADFLSDYPMNGEVDSYLNKVKTHAQTINSLETTNRNACGALLRIAYGELGESLVPNASACYAKCCGARGGARALLAADHPKAIDYGLLNARGCPLDDELFWLVKRVMDLPFSSKRAAAAEVLAQDEREEYLEAKTRLIIESIISTPKNPDATNLLTDNFSLFHYQWNMGEYECVAQAFALGKSKGVSKELLAQLTPTEAGLAKDAIVLARVLAGDINTAPDLHRILTNSPSAYCRWSAVRVLGILPGTLSRADVSALEYVKQHDPFLASGTIEGYRFLNRPMEKPSEKIYWLREIAKRILQERGKGAETSGQNK